MTGSTPSESAPHKSASLFESMELNEEDKRAQQIAELQADLAAEKDARREERFFFIFVVTIFFNLTIFSNVNNWAVPISTVVLQLILFVFVARRLGLEEVSTLFHGIIGRIADGVSKQ